MSTPTPLRDALPEALTLLRRLAAEGARPEGALQQLGGLRARLRGVAADLTWDHETVDGAVHYDVLLSDAEGTAALSYAPCGELPFPLRGAHRWRERDLLRVDGVDLPIEEAMLALDFLWRETRLLDRLVDTCLIKAELQRDPIVLDERERQAAVDGFRARRGLGTRQATEAWLGERGLALDQLEQIAADQEVLRRFRARAVGATPGEDEGAADRRFAAWLAERRAKARIEWNWGVEPALGGGA